MRKTLRELLHLFKDSEAIFLDDNFILIEETLTIGENYIENDGASAIINIGKRWSSAEIVEARVVVSDCNTVAKRIKEELSKLKGWRKRIGKWIVNRRR